MARNQSVVLLNDLSRWRRMEKHRFDDWCTDARHRSIRWSATKRNSMLFGPRRGSEWLEAGSRQVGGPANTGLITFRAPQWGWNRRLDVARGTRASDSCLLPSSLHYRWSSMLEEPWTSLSSSGWKPCRFPSSVMIRRDIAAGIIRRC